MPDSTSYESSQVGQVGFLGHVSEMTSSDFTVSYTACMLCNFPSLILKDLTPTHYRIFSLSIFCNVLSSMSFQRRFSFARRIN
jgi:hypothetical protein